MHDERSREVVSSLADGPAERRDRLQTIGLVRVRSLSWYTLVTLVYTTPDWYNLCRQEHNHAS